MSQKLCWDEEKAVLSLSRLSVTIYTARDKGKTSHPVLETSQGMAPVGRRLSAFMSALLSILKYLSGTQRVGSSIYVTYPPELIDASCSPPSSIRPFLFCQDSLVTLWRYLPVRAHPNLLSAYLSPRHHSSQIMHQCRWGPAQQLRCPSVLKLPKVERLSFFHLYQTNDRETR